MKGTEKFQTYEALLKLIEGHLSAHKMAQWNDEKVIERLSEMLLRRILKRFDVSYKRPGYRDCEPKDKEINEFGDDDWATPQD